MIGANRFDIGQIRDRAGDSESAIQGAHGQVQSLDGSLEKAPGGVIERTMLPNFLCSEVRVAKPRRTRAAGCGPLAGAEDPSPDGRGALRDG